MSSTHVFRLRRVFARAAIGAVVVTLAAGCTVSGPNPAGGSSDASGASASSSASVSAAASSTAAPSPTASGFGTSAHSIDDPDSIWVIVNKRRPFDPRDYAPADLVQPETKNVLGQPLRAEAAKAAEAAIAAANDEGIHPAIRSAYRSYETQKGLYSSYVAKSGKTEADRYSARPGYSEHQTGLAVDFVDLDKGCAASECFESTPSGKWLAKNAWQYGFILRYPKGLESVTGYIYEPWHFRYVGVDLATEMHKTGVATLEEFFGTGAAPDYVG